MRARSLYALTFALVGCSVDADDAQFLCRDGRCPSGQVCVDGVCRDDADDVDAGLDAAALDATTDATLDAPDDAPDATLGPEVCTPTPGTAADEDGDGAVDEDCPWHFGPAHPVLDVHVGPGAHWSPTPVADPSRLYFGYSGVSGAGDSGVFLAERVSPDARFELSDGEPVRVFGSPSDEPIYVITLSEDERVLVVQAGGELWRVERPTRGSAFEGATPLGPGSHPTLRGDGLELIFVAGGRAMRRERSSRTDEFGPPVEALPAASMDSAKYPSISRDGFTLFVGTSRGTLVATRDSLDVAFEPTTTTLSLGDSAMVSASTREVYFVDPNVGAPVPASQGIFRAEVCRDGPCPPRDVPCPDAFTAVRGTTSCYGSPGFAPSYGAAADACARRDATLLSLTSHSELMALVGVDLIPGMGGEGVWTGGITSSLAAGMVDYSWPTDEPFVEYVGAWQSRPGVGDLASRCIHVNAGGWIARPCSAAPTYTVVCEIVRWPTW